MSFANKILVIDDEPFIRLLLEELLGNEGYVLQSAASGEEAFAKLPMFNPDIILLDIHMAGMDGYRVCAEIRADKQYKFTKIIMVSGSAEVEERLQGYAVGADDYIGKPFDYQELLAKVKVYARLKRREEMDKVKGDLLTLLGHETRTPINSIKGCADILFNDQTLTDEQRKFADMIRQSSMQLHGFLENCLLLSKLKAGMKLLKTDENVDGILAALCQRIAKQYDDKCRFEITGDRHLVLHGDWQLLAKAFEFVLDNSMKYSPAGEVIKVCVEEAAEGWQIIIDDKGPGVDAKRREQVFDEFSIQDVAHHQKGQGISLAIVQLICASHNGTVKVLDNPEGQGARFVLTFPQSKGAEDD